MLQDQREDAGTQPESQMETLRQKNTAQQAGYNNETNLIESFMEFVEVFPDFICCVQL